MTEFKGQYFCQEHNKYHLEYRGEHYYFDTTRQAEAFMDLKEPPKVREIPKEKSLLKYFIGASVLVWVGCEYIYFSYFA